MSPIANYQIDNFVPEWIAPNVLTILSLFCVLIPHLIAWYMFPIYFEGDIPSWFCIMTGVLHFLYMNFDNLDGK